MNLNHRSRSLAGLLCLASIPALANQVSFSGYSFVSLYGTENLTLDGSGNLLVPTTASNFGGATTALPNGTVLITTSFLDSGSTAGPAAELWVQDFTNPLVYEAALGAFTGHSFYSFEYRIDGVSSTFQDTAIQRTAGVHTAAIEQFQDGSVDFFLDNNLVASASAAQFGIPVFADVVLTANGDAAGEQATFTSFTSAVPEPSYSLMTLGFLVALPLLRKLRRLA